MIILAALALLGAQADKAPDPVPVPLEPSAKWIAEFQDSFCGISRAFGQQGKDPIFGVKSVLPQDSMIDVMLITYDSDARPSETLSVADAAAPGKSVSGEVHPVVAKGQGWTVRMLPVDRDALMEIADGRPLRINYGRGRSVLIHPVNMTGAVKMLGTCEVDLAKYWKLDPEIARRVATPAHARDPSSWITVADYPGYALSNDHQGTVLMTWDIDVSGHVSNCRILSSSGHKELDDAACSAIMRRGRYDKPALDKDGNPIASYATRRVIWRVPR